MDEILALPADKLKHAKKKLRVQPCKALPPSLGGKEVKAAAAKDAKDKKGKGKDFKPKHSSKPSNIPSTGKLPKGDPTLGDRLASLSKDERKAAKASDPERLIRRAAKKEAVKAKAKMANKRDKVKLDVRGTSRKLKAGRQEVGKAKKGRVRSGRALEKMKGKRD